LTRSVQPVSHSEETRVTGELSGLQSTLRDLMPELLRYFGRRVPTREDAADCLGEAMLVLWRRRESVPLDHDGARRYAYGVAAKVLQESHRSRTRQSGLTARLIARHERVSHNDLEQDADGELWQALGVLRAVDRELILLVAWEGFGVGEAGAILGLSEQAARARYSRARARLRRVLTGSSSD